MFDTLSVFQIIVYISSLLSLLTILIYYWLIFGRLAFYNSKNKNNELYPVSVVISAKNEYLNLKENLLYILEQDYPQFEVIVVDDCSDDDSAYFLKKLAEQNPLLKVVTLSSTKNFFKGKKFPLSIGIKSAKYEHILLTDADCRPVSKNWIREMQAGFYGDTDIVLGFSPYEKTKGLLNYLIRYETFYTALQYLSFSLSGLTYMGVGRNLAYKRSLFFDEKGFTGHYQIASGDDDLFVNRAASHANTNIVISKDSFVTSMSKDSFAEWIAQKRRHLTTGKYYRLKHKFLLALLPFMIIIFYVSLILLFIYSNNIIFPFSLLFLKVVSQLIIYKKCMQKLEQRNFLLISLFLELAYIFFIFFIFLTDIIKQPERWS